MLLRTKYFRLAPSVTLPRMRAARGLLPECVACCEFVNLDMLPGWLPSQAVWNVVVHYECIITFRLAEWQQRA